MITQMEDEVARIRNILKDHPKGMTIEEISRLLPLNRTSTAKYLNTLLISGQAEMRTYGRAKVFSLTQRVPLSRLMSLSSDLILILDREQTVTYINDGFLEFFDQERENLTGKRMDQTSLPYYLSPEILAGIQRALEGKESSREQDIRIRDQDYYFITKLIPMVFDEGSGGVAIILEDITELKKYQRHLENLVEDRTREIIATNERLEKEIVEHRKVRESLEVVNKKLNLLASVTRHDILNQITAISGYIQLLNEELAGDPNISGYLNKVENAIATIQREITFTRDYKDLGIKPPEWQRVRDVIRRTAETQPMKSIRIDIRTGDLMVFADPFLEKVFANIFDNTIRNNGNVTEIKIYSTGNDQHKILVIEDNGGGIPVSLKSHLFEYGSGNTTTFNLFLSREILSITGLSISENGIEGKGARFEILLPDGTWRTGKQAGS
ncbi:MAG TPA: PAS domain-containing protein [Methanoregulaceae archaeon]|nr:PAS domain-containing protein [Methanoregulaceae archaeon]